MAGADSLPTKCEEREFLLSAESMWREAAVVIEQSRQLRIELAQGALLAQRERFRHEENCALCRQIEAAKKAAAEPALVDSLGRAGGL